MRGRGRDIAAGLVLLAAFATQAVAASGEEPPRCRGEVATIVGTSDDDALHGTEDPDVIWAGPGDDTVHGACGSDVICGGPGADLLYGGRGAGIWASLRAGKARGDGRDKLFRFDAIEGSAFSDTLIGDKGARARSSGRCRS